MVEREVLRRRRLIRLRRLQLVVFIVMLGMGLGALPFAALGQADWRIVGIALAAAVGPLTQVLITARNGDPIRPSLRGLFGTVALAMAACGALTAAGLQHRSASTWAVVGIFYLALVAVVTGAAIQSFPRRPREPGAADRR